MVLLSKVEIVDMVERIKILNHLGKIKEKEVINQRLQILDIQEKERQRIFGKKGGEEKEVRAAAPCTEQ